MTDLDAFKMEVEAFIAETGMAKTTFGRRARKEANFVDRLRAGSDVTTRTMTAVRDWMAAYRATCCGVSDPTEEDDPCPNKPPGRQSTRAA